MFWARIFKSFNTCSMSLHSFLAYRVVAGSLMGGTLGQYLIPLLPAPVSFIYHWSWHLDYNVSWRRSFYTEMRWSISLWICIWICTWICPKTKTWICLFLPRFGKSPAVTSLRKCWATFSFSYFGTPIICILAVLMNVIIFLHFLFLLFLFVVNFVIHWNEKALGSHVFPIPIPPHTSPPPAPSRSFQSTRSERLSHASNLGR